MIILGWVEKGILKKQEIIESQIRALRMTRYLLYPEETAAYEIITLRIRTLETAKVVWSEIRWLIGQRIKKMTKKAGTR